MSIFLSISIALIFGLLFTRVTGIFKLPDVSAYLIAGILIGPYCLGLLGIDGFGFVSGASVANVSFVSNAALGFIAFAIGHEFRLPHLKKIGKQAAVIGILQALVTAVVVDAALIGLHFLIPNVLSVPAAITLGAIATATAPAATLMVVRQYKARGKLTDLLLPIVALDDAVGLAVFAVSFGIARALSGGDLNILSVAVEPIVEIVASLLLGAAIGVLLTKCEKVFNSNRNRMSLIIGFVIITVGLSMIEFTVGKISVGFSPLLVCMMLGTVFCNMCPLANELMNLSDVWSAPLIAVFFVISGASLELSVFTNFYVILIGAAFIFSRCIGKYFGAYFSCGLMHTAETVKKNLGITLFPQAGVALGMCVTAASLPNDGVLIRNIVLFAVLIYELFGPVLTKTALIRSGDIKEKSDEIKNRRLTKLASAKK